jgi:hypothetical protein
VTFLAAGATAGAHGGPAAREAEVVEQRPAVGMSRDAARTRQAVPAATAMAQQIASASSQPDRRSVLAPMEWMNAIGQLA